MQGNWTQLGRNNTGTSFQTDEVCTDTSLLNLKMICCKIVRDREQNLYGPSAQRSFVRNETLIVIILKSKIIFDSHGRRFLEFLRSWPCEVKLTCIYHSWGTLM